MTATRRRELWIGLSVDQKLDRAADDLDEGDAQFEQLRKDLAHLTGWLVGFTLSFAGAAVAFALNLATRGT